MPDMTTIEQRPLNELIKGGLENSGLSRRAINAARKIGDFVQTHPKLPLLIGATGYLGEVVVNQALHPEWGIGANIFSPVFFDVSPVEERYSLNALQGLFQAMFVGGGATGVVSGLAEKAREMFYLPDIKRGRAKNPYKQMVLMVDTTNEATEGSTHGDFYNEFYRYLLVQRRDLLSDLIKRYGPVCEITPDNVPEPVEEPVPAYFRTTNLSNTEFLGDFVKAKRTKGTISVLMSRSHTVWDEEFTPSQPVLDTANNMNSTITDTLGVGDIPKIVITNNREVSTHGAFDPATGKTRVDSTSAKEYFSNRGYEVVIAEQEVMTDLVDAFRRKQYKRVILMNDGTSDGKRIAANWLNDYRQNKSNDNELPEIIEVPEGKLGEVLQGKEYDGIFLIGAEDTRVAEAAQAIFEKQMSEREETRGYRIVPMEVLMEGRGSADKLVQVTKNGGDLHFVHEVLAKKAVDILLK